jgi:predicted ATP-grasp superfamily ATP-dependent carboligase
MDHLRWSREPELSRPVLLVAFEGWNDAGDAASSAVRYLRDRWQARPFADIDAEAFYDFTQARPHVRLVDGQHRRIEWPRNRFFAASVTGLDGDVVLLDGTEPALMWRTFCEQVLEVARRHEAQLLLTLGALISDVPHSRPVQIYGVGYDTDAVARLGVEPSTYEGPTGIVGVLHAHFREAGVPSASLWAAVPSYVHSAPSPKAALALVNKVGAILRVPIATTDLEIAAAAYERQVSKVVADDDDTTELVRQLEERHDEMGESGSLVEEVERFLRDSAPDE